MTAVDAAADAFGRALLDHQQGRDGATLILEGDDASTRTADLQPEDFFAPPDAWPAWERWAVGSAAGAVLDLGAGAGRHARHLQDLGHPVTAVDSSPGAVEVCRARGIADVRLADLRTRRDLGAGRPWGTILLMGGNLGLAGDWEPTRSLLTRIAAITAPGGLLIGDSVDPTSDDPEDQAYEARNLESGFHRAHVRLRLRYEDLVTPWWDQLNIPPTEIDSLVEGAGWTLQERAGDDDGYAVVLHRE